MRIVEVGLVLIEGTLRRCIVVGEDEAHAGRGFCLAGIERSDTPAADRSTQDEAMELAGIGAFGGVGRDTRDLERALDAIAAFTDHRGAPVACASVAAIV